MPFTHTERERAWPVSIYALRRLLPLVLRLRVRRSPAGWSRSEISDTPWRPVGLWASRAPSRTAVAAADKVDVIHLKNGDRLDLRDQAARSEHPRRSPPIRSAERVGALGRGRRPDQPGSTSTCSWPRASTTPCAPGSPPAQMVLAGLRRDHCSRPSTSPESGAIGAAIWSRGRTLDGGLSSSAQAQTRH